MIKVFIWLNKRKINGNTNEVGVYTDQLADYLHYVTVERGLSTNTRTSYRQDLVQFFHFLMHERNSMPLQDVDRFTILDF
ncbi:site-specific tyrosine recombinase XerC [Weissella viridescens]|uniref:Site-specific tyrosine recombinase XerC n=1 Tax=Weissella viridescens TaxID=1629 RepID=A0A380P288_WEIVI|nr:site-specific tyrosine recombinase XerC [Weissella viridescens]